MNVELSRLAERRRKFESPELPHARPERGRADRRADRRCGIAGEGGVWMQADELKGRGVLALSNAEKIGQVEDVLFDAQFSQVLGFRVRRGGLFAKAQALLRDSVTSVGADALTVPSPDVINDEERIAELAHAATLSQVERTQVITESGDLLGTIAHLEMDDDARKVTAYVLSSSLRERMMRHDTESIKADEVLRLGEGGIMVVADSVGARLRS